MCQVIIGGHKFTVLCHYRIEGLSSFFGGQWLVATIHPPSKTRQILMTKHYPDLLFPGRRRFTEVFFFFPLSL
jgi:hypothetical protein